MAIFVKAQHQVTWKKLLAKLKITKADKNFEETLIRVCVDQQEQIEKLEVEISSLKGKQLKRGLGRY